MYVPRLDVLIAKMYMKAAHHHGPSEKCKSKLWATSSHPRGGLKSERQTAQSGRGCGEPGSAENAGGKAGWMVALENSLVVPQKVKYTQWNITRQWKGMKCCYLPSMDEPWKHNTKGEKPVPKTPQMVRLPHYGMFRRRESIETESWCVCLGLHARSLDQLKSGC